MNCDRWDALGAADVTVNEQEFSDYMEWLVRFGAEKFDVVIPLPDEVAA
jgi:hypothetical protein